MPSNVNYQANIWALYEEGCTHLLVTTACGSLREEIQPGDIVIIDQFIDRWVEYHTLTILPPNRIRSPSMYSQVRAPTHCEILKWSASYQIVFHSDKICLP